MGKWSRAKYRGNVNDGLILRIAQDDGQALEALYAETSAAVYGFILSIVRNPHTAEDLMQETYIKVYLSAARYVPQGKPMAWVLTISRNLALMKLRERASQHIPLEAERSVFPAGKSPEAALDSLMLEAAMNILGDEERQIIMLHAVAGAKHREIAALLEIPLPTVLSKYRRALAKLNKHMREAGQDEA